MKCITFAIVVCFHVLAARWCDAQTAVLGKPYTKLASRAETREAFLRMQGGSSVEWGRWWLLAPITHEQGGKDIATAYPPEEQLAVMKVGGPGPDLKAKYDGVSGKIGWREVEDKSLDGGGGGPRFVDIEELLKLPERPKKMAAYLYRQIVATTPASVPVNVGSDDGVRIWLNGELVLDVNAERPMSVGDNRVVLRVKPGVNHLFVKVSQGAGEWRVAVVPDYQIDPVLDAALEYRLDEDFPEGMTPYYRIVTIPTPPGEVIEVGGIDALPDGRPILCTRRGDVWIVDGAYEMPPVKARWKRFATGLQEPLGVAVRNENGKTVVYCAQRTELTRLADSDGDDVADVFETVCSQWQVSGNYHEYAFGPVFDRDGNAWVNLNLAHTDGETVMGATVASRGWAVKIGRDGVLHKVADGLRSPDGLGLWSDGQMFYTDNQGDYVATNKLSPLFEGSFQGHQASLKFREDFGTDWKKSGKEAPAYVAPAVWFPYKKMGQSACGFMLDSTKGKFGPFAGQLFVGEQTYAWVMRASIEKLMGENGKVVYQGACYPFREGLASGVHRVCFAPDGSLLVGMTDRGWGSTGPKRFGLQRLVWTGKVPFEIREMKAAQDGFIVEFTKPVGDDALEAGKYAMQSYTYEYHPQYGSAEMDTAPHVVKAVERVAENAVRLRLDRVRTGPMGYVHELHVKGLKSRGAEGAPAEELMHDAAYYTLQMVPKP